MSGYNRKRLEEVLNNCQLYKTMYLSAITTFFPLNATCTSENENFIFERTIFYIFKFRSRLERVEEEIRLYNISAFARFVYILFITTPLGGSQEENSPKLP